MDLRDNNRANVAVIGAGIAGLATAIRLAIKGYKVEVFESNGYPGGKLSEIKSGDFRFDAGPSLFTMPQYVDELFSLAGKQPTDYFSYHKLDIICNYFYEDGTKFSAHADKLKFAKELSALTKDSQESILQNLKNSHFLYDHLGELFVRKPIHSVKTFLSKQAFKSYFKLHQFGLFSSMHEANAKQFKDPKTVQLFNRYATYNGSDPYQTPATMNIIPHLEFNIGAFFPEGGMISITNSLQKLAQELGVKFHFNQKVQKILTRKKKVYGIMVNDEALIFNRVVSNMDMVNTYKHLLAHEKHPKKLLSQPKSSSALIFYWGIAKEFPKLDVHNIFFSKDYKQEFDHIFQRSAIYEDPTVYINISSKMNENDAPKGQENWFTMINVPNNSGQDWDEMIPFSREKIITKLSNMLGQDISKLIVTEEILDPRLIESRTSSAQGALYGNSSNNRYAAFLRHANYSSKLKNLYFCGGSVHPGGGIPLALSSAKLVADLFPSV